MDQEVKELNIKDLVLWTENPRDPIDEFATDQDIVDKASLCVNIDVASNKEVNYGIFKSSDGRRVKKSLAA